jgi:hypothetical protein
MEAALLAKIGTVVSTVGSVVGMVGSMQAASYQAAVAERNARLMDENARREADRGQVEGQDYGEQARAQLGALIASRGASGVNVNSGTALATRNSQEGLARRDQFRIRHDSQLAGDRMRQSAQDFRMEAGQARQAGRFAFMGGLLDSASSLIGGARQVRRIQGMNSR